RGAKNPRARVGTGGSKPPGTHASAAATTRHRQHTPKQQIHERDQQEAPFIRSQTESATLRPYGPAPTSPTPDGFTHPTRRPLRSAGPDIRRMARPRGLPLPTVTSGVPLRFLHRGAPV